jgi:uncharacterized DUF497 family protein
MKGFEWNEEKNLWLRENRNISFEEIIFCIENDGLLETIEHPNKLRFSHQKMFIVQTKDYVYLVPFVEEETYYFLKTVIPSRKAKKKYERNRKNE